MIDANNNIKSHYPRRDEENHRIDFNSDANRTATNNDANRTANNNDANLTIIW